MKVVTKKRINRMKQLSKITGLAILICMSIFTSCKKEKFDLKTSNMELSSEYDGVQVLNLYQNELTIRGKLSPKDISASQIEIKITSDADPNGFVFNVNLSDRELKEGGNVFLYKDLYTIVSAGNFTDASRKIIKVNPDGDNINVSLNNDFISGSFPISCAEVIHITYWPSDHTATLFLRGYDYTGNENKFIHVWTSQDPFPLKIYLSFDDPTQYAGLPNFENFKTNLAFVNSFSATPNYLGVLFQEDMIYIEYNSVVYWSILGANTFAPLMRTQM